MVELLCTIPMSLQIASKALQHGDLDTWNIGIDTVDTVVASRNTSQICTVFGEWLELLSTEYDP